MAAFPRAVGALPRLATPPRFPVGLQSWGLTGKGQLRAVQNMGRTWDEIYPILDTTNPNVRALLETLNRSMRQGIVWSVQHPYWHRRDGVGGGAAVVGSAFRQVWQVDSSPLTFVDRTTAANNATANDWGFFVAGAGANDYAAMGFPVQFARLSINVGTAGVGTYVVTWEYWNGAAWAALTGVVDGTTGFKTAGTNNVTFTIPADWVPTSLNGSAQLYFVRARRDGGTVTTDPLGTQGFVRDKTYGSTLIVDTAPPATTGWLKQGDMIQVAGGAVVYDVTAQVDTDAVGGATIPISPPIFAGGSPADGGAVTVDPTAITFNAVIVGVHDYPDMDTSRYIDAGLTVTWREQPQ